MKIALITVLILHSISAFSQKPNDIFPIENGKVVYQQLDSAITASSTDLYNRAKLWVANAFRSSKNVIQIDDKEAGTILGKGNFDVIQTMTPYIIRFTFKIDVRDNRYRIRFYDISSQQDTQMGKEQSLESLIKKNGFGNVKEKINNRFEKLITEVTVAMARQADNF